MELKLDAGAMAAIAGRAILEEMSSETRNTLVQEAIQHLLEPTNSQRNSWEKHPSPLQQAFNNAIETQARIKINELLESDPEFNDLIQELLGPILSETLRSEGAFGRQGLSDTIGKAVGQWLNEQAMKRSDG